jgi:hypothetical protein
VWRQIAHCYLWTCYISCDQQPNEHYGSTQAGGDHGKECKAWAVFWHFKLLTDNSAQGQRLPSRNLRADDGRISLPIYLDKQDNFGARRHFAKVSKNEPASAGRAGGAVGRLRLPQ